MAVGNAKAAGRTRKPRKPEQVAARVKRLRDFVAAKPAEGVVPLNAGFFALQRMREATVAKARKGKRRVKVKSK